MDIITSITIIIVVTLICATIIHCRHKERYDEIITSSLFQKLQEHNNKTLGKTKAVLEFSTNAYKTINNENLTSEFKLTFCKNSYFTIINLLKEYE